MSKLVITTQYLENYSFDVDGFPSTEPDAYFKPKGGTTYVMENLSSRDLNEIAHGTFMPVIQDLVSYNNEVAREYVISWDIVEDDAKVGESWEAPIFITLVGGRWKATRTTVNDEYRNLVPVIRSYTESWLMSSDAEKEFGTYTKDYVVRVDGEERIAKENEVLELIEEFYAKKRETA
jgi:hypothetical protein